MSRGGVATRNKLNRPSCISRNVLVEGPEGTVVILAGPGVVVVVRHLRALVEGGRGGVLAAVLVVLVVVGVPVLAKIGVDMPGRKKEPDHKRSSARPGGGTRPGRSRGGTEQGVDAQDADCR